MPETLSYSSGRAAPGFGLLKLAIALGVFPAVCGIAIALLFVATEWERLKAAGFFCIMGGVLLVLIALGLLAVHAADHLRFGLRSRWSVARDVLLVLLILGLNLPAMWVSLWIVRPVTARYELTITNGLPVPAEQVDIHVGRQPKVSVGPLAPGASVTRTWRLVTDSMVSVRTQIGGVSGETMIDYYVDPSVGPHRRSWTINPAATQPAR